MHEGEVGDEACSSSLPQLPCSWEGLATISAGRVWGAPGGMQVHRTTDPENFRNCSALASSSLFFFCVSSLLPHPKSWMPTCSPTFLLYLDHSQKFVIFYVTPKAHQMFRIYYLQLLESSGAATGGCRGFHLGYCDWCLQLINSPHGRNKTIALLSLIRSITGFSAFEVNFWGYSLKDPPSSRYFLTCLVPSPG